MTTLNRTLVEGKKIEDELVGEVDGPTTTAEPAKQLTVGIDAAFVKAKHDQAAGHSKSSLGRVEQGARHITPQRLSILIRCNESFFTLHYS
jgi:hypothetical protein